MKLKRLIIWILPSLLLFTAASCEKDPPHPKPPTTASRTLLVYMAMDNSIGSYGYAQTNINGLLAGSTQASLNNGRILIYKDIPGLRLHPVLLEIRLNKYGKPFVDTLEHYQAQNSADAQVFRRVLDDAKRHAPAYKYALDIGSHATGWIPGDFDMIGSRARTMKQSVDPEWLTRAVANDGTRWMELSALAGVLADNELEYILFDACFMGGVESIYALRNKARHIIASPAEVLIAGMPYDRIVGDLMATTPNLQGVCEKYFSYYQARSAAIALYDCSRMELLADAMRPVYARDMATVEAMDPLEVQRLTSRAFKPVIFDMADFMACLMPTTDPLYTLFSAALNQVVLYQKCTPVIMNDTPIEAFCGMATYIPAASMDAGLNAAWRQTEWARDVLN